MEQKNIQLFAVTSKSTETQKVSSSGGAFSEIAKYVFSQNGVVFGAAFDEKLKLIHKCAENEKQLEPLRGSKYVESIIGNSYNQALSLASQGKLVLFSGTPCQIAGLNMLSARSNLSTEQKNHIVTCDVICHGVVPQEVFQQYIAFLSEKNHCSVEKYSFRDKTEGWETPRVHAFLANGTEYFGRHFEDPYMIGYFKHFYLRENCYNCKFAKIPRQGDLTLGDYWGAPKQLYDRNGVSVVSVNTAKGTNLFSKIENINKTPISLETVLPNNPCFIEHTYVKPPARDAFFETLKTEGYKKASEKYLKQSIVTKSVMLAKKILR